MKIPRVKALTFDVGGTVFDWRSAIVDELQSLSAEKGVEVDHHQFASDWRRGMFQTLGRMRQQELPQMNADQIHRMVLDDVLETHDTIQLSVEERDDLNNVWHRMKTWPDANVAIQRLRGSYSVVVLTILSYAIVVDCSKNNDLHWDGILSCEFLDQYKGHPRAYQQGAELLGLEPAEVMMVAAHGADLKAAKDAGLKTAYVHRENEWVSEFPTTEPIHALDTFDVSATDFDDLVKKLT
jgi:2-haloacid dehalogenase